MDKALYPYLLFWSIGLLCVFAEWRFPARPIAYLSVFWRDLIALGLYNVSFLAVVQATDRIPIPNYMPIEIGLPFFVSDLRADSELPENVIRDGAMELGFAASDKIESDIVGDFASLTGGTVGTAGSAITWSYVAAGIARARNANKSVNVPLVYVLHGYQWAVLAKAASVAGATLAQAPGFTQDVTTKAPIGQVATFMGVRMYQTFQAPNGSDDFTGAIFPRDALAIDWRRPIRIEPERKASRRGTQYNMSAVYAHGVWRPALGVQMVFDATAPTS